MFSSTKRKVAINPGNVSMKATQGIVSSEAVCYSCHDGYVLNPRDSVCKHQSHTTFIKGQPSSEAGPCSVCHVPHDSSGLRLWTSKTASGNPASHVCLSCHKKAPGSKIKGIGKYSHPDDVEMVSEKDGKPLPAPRLEKLPRFSVNGDLLSAGSMQCLSCHNTHQWDPVNLASQGGKNVEGDGARSFSWKPASPGAHLCIVYQESRALLIETNYDLFAAAPSTENTLDWSVSETGTCNSCHAVYAGL